MIVTDKLIYLDLQKTGSAYMASVLSGLSGFDKLARHAPLSTDRQGRAVVGTIRNPFDWYVSIWAYGCQGKGTLRWFLTASPRQILMTLTKQTLTGRMSPGDALVIARAHAGKDVEFWRDVYSDATDPERFRTWLSALLSPQGSRFTDERFSRMPLAQVCGFMSGRFLKIYCNVDHWRDHAATLTSQDDIRGFFDRACEVEQFLRMETLAQDLGAVLAVHHPEYDFAGSEFASGKRINSSKRSKTPDYFDEAGIALVRERDSLLFDLFDYPVSPSS